MIQVIKEEEINKLVNEYHSFKIGGHVGINKMEKRLKQFYIFKNMKRKIENVIKRCEICQKNKYGKQTKMPMEITSTAKKPFERIALDIVGPLPETENGNKYLLTYQDDLTKYVEAIPMENQEAETITYNFVTHILLRHSSPETILTDNGSNFVSDLFKRVCKMLGINRSYATPYHPETNGALERTHRTLKEHLRCYINEGLNDWDTWIPYAVYTFNTTPHSSTNFSPYELLYGFKPILPNTLKTKPQAVYNYDNYLFELKYRLQRSHTIARENQVKSKNTNKNYYDRNTKEIVCSPGQLVLMENVGKTGQGRKLQKLYTGPYRVIACPTNINTEIQIKHNRTKVVHNNLLKPFYSTVEQDE